MHARNLSCYRDICYRSLYSHTASGKTLYLKENKFTKQRKYKNDQNVNGTFYILSLLVDYFSNSII